MIPHEIVTFWWKIFDLLLYILKKLEKENDSCLYQIQSENSNNRLKFEIKHFNADCSHNDVNDRVYLFTQSEMFGPFCHRKYRTRERRSAATFSTKEEPKLCGICSSDEDCGDKIQFWMKCGEQGHCICHNSWVDRNSNPNDGCETFQAGKLRKVFFCLKVYSIKRCVGLYPNFGVASRTSDSPQVSKHSYF